jgi:hypothetical protein
MRVCACAVIALLGLMVGTSGAEPIYENRQWTRLGLEGGAISGVDDVGQVGVQAAMGWSLGSVHLAGEYALSHGWAAAPDESTRALGFGHRLGAVLALPVTFARVPDRSMEIAFWLEAGGGVHRLAGAEAWRRNAFIGWAAEYRGRRCGGSGGMGFWLGGRVLLTEPEAESRTVAIGGQVPGSTSGFGVGYLATLAWRWGR